MAAKDRNKSDFSRKKSRNISDLGGFSLKKVLKWLNIRLFRPNLAKNAAFWDIFRLFRTISSQMQPISGWVWTIRRGLQAIPWVGPVVQWGGPSEWQVQWLGAQIFRLHF